MTASIALIRHGQTDWNLAGRLQGQTDIPLNATGRQQAREVGRSLQAGAWDLVLASPLGRAQQTAELIAEEAGLATGRPVAGVMERFFGELEGRIPAELPEGAYEQLLESAESSHAVTARLTEALCALAEEYPGQRILCVSHGGAMRRLRDALLGCRLPEPVANGEMLPVPLPRLYELAGELGIEVPAATH
ncbi:histidine phosphatase family protein [Glutamicibacter sp. PS]|uniref:histidine phosphatase family protein n=1 Tax=Glutamicibacter sp. PS TaxID=3075634 RepID=UPI00284A2631|nr:histidine phosphatase family protein [Glutamicibacter sp. PS]MDR4534650.1 histidine phosphatase family protein [Glutamicibacter sp. PS]